MGTSNVLGDITFKETSMIAVANVAAEVLLRGSPSAWRSDGNTPLVHRAIRVYGSAWPKSRDLWLAEYASKRLRIFSSSIATAYAN